MHARLCQPSSRANYGAELQSKADALGIRDRRKFLKEKQVQRPWGRSITRSSRKVLLTGWRVDRKISQIRAWTGSLLTVPVLARPGRGLSGCEQRTKVARVCRNSSEKSSYENGAC